MISRFSRVLRKLAQLISKLGHFWKRPPHCQLQLSTKLGRTYCQYIWRAFGFTKCSFMDHLDSPLLFSIASLCQITRFYGVQGGLARTLSSLPGLGYVKFIGSNLYSLIVSVSVVLFQSLTSKYSLACILESGQQVRYSDKEIDWHSKKWHSQPYLTQS